MAHPMLSQKMNYEIRIVCYELKLLTLSFVKWCSILFANCKKFFLNTKIKHFHIPSPNTQGQSCILWDPSDVYSDYLNFTPFWTNGVQSTNLVKVKTNYFFFNICESNSYKVQKVNFFIYFALEKNRYPCHEKPCITGLVI